MSASRQITCRAGRGGCCAIGLAGWVPGHRSEGPATVHSFPCHPKIFRDLASWQFLKCYFKSPKKGNIKVQAVHGHPSWYTQTAAQYNHPLWCPVPAVINSPVAPREMLWRKGKCSLDECELLFPSKALLRHQYYFMFHWLNWKNSNCVFCRSSA